MSRGPAVNNRTGGRPPQKAQGKSLPGTPDPQEKADQAAAAQQSTGMFNFKQMMDDFYNYKPEEGDTMGQMQKQAFMGNFLQSMVDQQLAQQQSQFAAAIGQQNMSHVADLELRNQSATMQDQFNYAMQNMEAQFQYGNTAANAQHDRDIGMLAATGQQQRDNMEASGQQDRLGEIVKGEQDRLKQDMVNQSAEAQVKYKSDSDYRQATDTQSIASEANKQIAETEKDAMTETQGIRSKGEVDVAKEAAGASKYGADRTVDVAEVNAQGTIDNTKETGTQTRLTMGEETRQKAKDRANMHSYARSTARAM
tara:strand:+ start:52 stop:981 length:930 start_codon:yes stop_codon:yes gene_type:complete